MDILCFSHLRWHLVTQRPQHLLRRAARQHRVFFWEEPVWTGADTMPTHPMCANAQGCLELIGESASLFVIRPHLVHGVDADEAQRALLAELMKRFVVENYLTWYYTPMALAFSRHLAPAAVVYDCMDELKNFAQAPPELALREDELFDRADVVFTGGVALFEAKRERHGNVYAFPSSIDRAHFAQAREATLSQPADQIVVPQPRAGFFGVIDERFDVSLLAVVAHRLPQVHFVLLGPVVKIDLATLPRAANIHYLGSKRYEELPAYLAGWDVALLPFAINAATEFISPTKTPEYLAAGVPVVSTPVRDVVRGYGDAGLVAIAATAEEFASAVLRALQPQPASWRDAVDRQLAQSSWDLTWSGMWSAIESVLAKKAGAGGSHTGALEGVPALSEQAIKGRRVGLAQANHNARPAARVLPYVVPERESTSKRWTGSGREQFDYVVAGAGFAGAVLAERLASQLGRRVLVVDRREHIGGNAYDAHNADGILIHPYGPHIFHTNSAEVVEYLSQFTAWRPYEHRVLASVQGKLLPIPINLDTVNGLYGLHLDSAGMKDFLAAAAARETPTVIRTSEDIVVSRVGRELYELFFRNYTRKQWGVEPSALDSSVAGRIPVRFDRDDRYFNDSFQAMPKAGYTALFERMLDHPGITVRTGVDFSDVARVYRGARTVYTGPIDEFFGFRFGPLPYRSLEFRHETHAQAMYQTAAVVNYPNEHEYTRVTEFKYLTGQTHAKTSIVREYPRSEGDPYYPIPCAASAALYQRYRELAAREPKTIFCGRLASYRYFNMDQVVAQALMLYRKLADEQTVALPAAAPMRPGVAQLRAATGELA